MSSLGLSVRGAVIQDGIRFEGDRVAGMADVLASRIREPGLARIALVTDRAASVVTVLAAAEQAGCEVMLVRPEVASDPDWCSFWDVEAVVDDQLELTPAPGRRPESTGFAVLLTTSGTTGRPKAARHRAERLLGRIGTPSPGAAKAVWLLTYHPATFAGLQVILSCVVGGGDLVAVSTASAPNLATAAVCNPVTHISATPTFWRAFLAALGAEATRVRPKRITLGGEIVDQPTLDLLGRAFPAAAITHIYASTEAGALFAVQDRLEGFPARWLDRPVDGVGLRIRNDILEVRSPRAMEGYLDTSRQALFSDDGWLITNDFVTIRGDRVLFRGRADSLINVGGAKVTPEEVELVLLQIPGIRDVRVFGKANPITGAIVAADVTLADGHDEQVVRQAIEVRARERLAAYKVPRIVTFSSEVRMSQAGKKLRAPG